MTQFLSDEGAVHETVADSIGLDVRRRTVRAAADLASRWPALAFEKRRAILLAFVSRIMVTADGIEMLLRPSAISVITDAEFDPDASALVDKTDRTVRLHVPTKMRRIGKGHSLVINGTQVVNRKPDPALVRLLQQAQRYRDLILAGDGRTMAEIAEEVGVGASYFSRIVRFGFLAPDIVRSILDGSQPIGLSAKKLSLGVTLPAEWDAQKKLLGFS
ncbi:hypothetical protein [Thalassobaculum sp.]|uniref:hypothetical protein n=1 Tax=Thalassobaculum sp. TaxID=2022740 RepID=UPI0032EF1862